VASSSKKGYQAKPIPVNNWPKAQTIHSNSLHYHPNLLPQYNHSSRSYQQNNKNSRNWETTNQVLIQILTAEQITNEELKWNKSTKPSLNNSPVQLPSNTTTKNFKWHPPATLTNTYGYLQYWPSSRIHPTGAPSRTCIIPTHPKPRSLLLLSNQPVTHKPCTTASTQCSCPAPIRKLGYCLANLNPHRIVVNTTINELFIYLVCFCHIFYVNGSDLKCRNIGKVPLLLSSSLHSLMASAARARTLEFYIMTKSSEFEKFPHLILGVYVEKDSTFQIALQPMELAWIRCNELLASPSLFVCLV